MESEQQLQSKLQLAAGGCSGDDTGGWTKDCCLRASGRAGALLRTGAEDDRVGRRQIGVVKDVEELSAELGTQAFVDGGGFCEREVEVREARTGECVSAQVANGAGGGREE